LNCAQRQQPASAGRNTQANKMKNALRIAALLPALVTALLLSGCGGATGAPGTSAAQPVATTPAPTQTSTLTPGSYPITLSASTYAVSQDAGVVAIPVVRTGPAAEAVSVDYATSDLSAIAGTNYTAASGTLSWQANDSSQRTITVHVNGSAAFAGDRTFAIALSKPSAAAVIGSPGSARISISGTASGSTGTLAFADAAASISQSAPTAVIAVNRSGGAIGATSVNYATSAGSALAGIDFTTATGTLNWADGDSAAKMITVALGAVPAYSGSREFTVTLSGAASGALIGDVQTTTITIVGDASAAPGSVQFSAAQYAVGQAAGKVTLLAKRVGGSSGIVSVNYSTVNGSAAAGTDFTNTSGVLTWSDGDTASKTIDIPVSNSTPFSGTRTFTVNLTGPSAGATLTSPATATVTVTGDAPSSQSKSTFWVYQNGVFNWGGDYSFGATINYHSTSGSPQAGAADTAVMVTSPWGAWQPYAGGTVPMWNFDATGYNYLTVDLKPTLANQSWKIYFMQVGDVVIQDAGGNVESVNVADYGPTPVLGRWATYRIPLSAVLTQHKGGQPTQVTSVYKFAIQDQTGLASNVWYVDNAGFTQ
jgi:hypothetical protein